MWIKICGITNPTDAEMCVAAGPDALGLNFYKGSPRRADPETAREIVARLPDSVMAVGVFVNHPADEIRSICERTGIRTVQLHGDEPPEFAASLAGLEIIRVFRVGEEEGLGQVADELDAYQRLGISLRGCLVDASVAGVYGGSGKTAPWELLAAGWHRDWPALILAGGLTPGNVADAVTKVHPFGIDVASGVEESPGKKDHVLVSRLIATARAAAAASQFDREQANDLSQ